LVEENSVKVGRRAFLSLFGLGAVGLALGEPVQEPKGPIYDFHVHLFGVGDGGTGCWLSEKHRKHWNYSLFRKLLGLREGQVDQDYVRTLVRQLSASSTSKAVLLAHDGRYDLRGNCDHEATDVYVPNDYLFRVVAAHPELFIPCISINPKRRDALEELDRCATAGARVMKIHPPIQDVDPAEPRFRPFYRRVAELGVLLMIHTGMEPAPGVSCQALGDPARLLPALEEGCTVIASHAGMGGYFDPKKDYEQFFPHLLRLIRQFPNLYCDISFLASTFYWRALPRLREESSVVDRLIYASDWPWPSNPLVFWSRLSASRVLSLSAETNLFERDFRLKQALGLPPAVFERGARLLA